MEPKECQPTSFCRISATHSRALMSRKGPTGSRDVRGPEEQGAGTAETLFLDIIISTRHQSVNPSVPAQQSKASRGCPSLWKEGSAERRAVKVDRIM